MFSDHVNSAPGREGRVRCPSEGSLEGGKTVAVRQCVNSLPGFAHPALAGCPEGGIVLDPFMGSGTTGMVAAQMGRHFVGIELNPEYTELAYKRIGGEI